MTETIFARPRPRHEDNYSGFLVPNTSVYFQLETFYVITTLYTTCLSCISHRVQSGPSDSDPAFSSPALSGPAISRPAFSSLDIWSIIFSALYLPPFYQSWSSVSGHVFSVTRSNAGAMAKTRDVRLSTFDSVTTRAAAASANRRSLPAESPTPGPTHSSLTTTTPPTLNCRCFRLLRCQCLFLYITVYSVLTSQPTANIKTLLKITERSEYQLLSLTYKVLTTTQPSYLHNLIIVQPPRSTRSSSLSHSLVYPHHLLYE